jgi:hypothetical protein
MGLWQQDAQGGYRLFGFGRTAAIASETLTTEKTLKLQLAPYDLNHNVFALIPSSGDGRTAYEVGCVGTSIYIRTVVFGDPASVTVRASALHGLGAGVPFTLEVRVVNGVIEARLNGSDTPIVDFDMSTASPTVAEGYKHFGFVSNVDGARVIAIQLCELVPITVNRADVLVAVCGGNVWAALDDGGGIALVANGVFNSTGEVCIFEHDQKMLGVDGVHAKVIDALALTVTNWTAAFGSLPGATADGTTTAKFGCSWRGRVWLEDGQNLLASAINDRDDWDTGDDTYGHAFGLTAASIGKIGQPLTALFPTTRDTLGLGCNNSIWELIGDPATGQPQIQPLLKGSGVSGKDAFTVSTSGIAICHTPDGPYIVPPAGEAVPMAASVLSEGLTIPRTDIGDYYVQVRRDPKRHMVYFMLTPKTGDGSATHLAYDERTGAYSPGNGGWFPDDFVERLGPTASTPEPWLGDVIFGTRDGYLMRFSDDALADDGVAFVPRCPVSLMQEAKVQRETILHKHACLYGIGSVVKYRLYGGVTPEGVYGASTATQRQLLQSGTYGGQRMSVDRKSRAPALMLELYTDTAGLFELEQVDAVTEPGRIVTRRNFLAITIPEACVPSIYGTSISSDPSFSSGTGYHTLTGFTVQSSGESVPPTSSGAFTTGHSFTVPITGISAPLGSTAPGFTFNTDDGLTIEVSGTTVGDCTIVTGPDFVAHTVCPTSGIVTINEATGVGAGTDLDPQ